MPPGTEQIATLEASVLPNSTVASAVAHRAVESTYPRPSLDGAAEADGIFTASNVTPAVTATVRQRRGDQAPDIGYH
ncbi:hypothetical protein MBOE_11110 [Mycolicibacterium boenickei]|uniref:Uncharacterized protein n=1 Tax=Mycolicibacterium boenickei TaxID=146017 RepID=A0ABM7IRN1_9MYCO|nr:hypothetical protein MBOE_11110 [Mycolicibacterium boenickei]